MQFQPIKFGPTAYPTVELGGIIWAYMGPRENMPPLPEFEWTQMPATHRHVSKVIEECNWLQALEGGIDTSHAPILHRTISASTNRAGVPLMGPFVQGKAPTLEVDVTDYGYRYVGIRPWRRTRRTFAPTITSCPSRRSGRSNSAIVVESNRGPRATSGCPWTMRIAWCGTGCIAGGMHRSPRRSVWNALPAMAPTTSIRRTFRSKVNRRNGWLIDRQVQKTETFTGIEGINAQDRGVQESMGPIVDRSKEYLGPADRAIIVTRRLLLQAVKTVEDGGDPPGADTSYYRARAVERILPKGVEWRDALLSEMYPGAEPMAVAH